MSERDYALEDSQLDDELRALYAQDSESEVNPEPENPDDTGTSPEVQTQESQSDDTPAEPDGTVIDDEPVKEQPEEKTVPEFRYKEATAAMHRAQQELADRRKQDAARDQLIQQLQEQVQQLQEKPAAKEAESTPEMADDDDLKEALDLYPEAVAPLLKRNAALEKKLANLEKRLIEVDDSVGNVKTVADRFTQTEQQTAEDKYWTTIRSKHDDVDELINDPAYLDWYPNQSPMIQQALQLKFSAQDVVSALNLFRAEYPKAAPEKEAEPVVTKPVTHKADKLAEARAASSPTIKGGQKPENKKAYTNDEISRMSIKEWGKHENEILAAMVRGEID